MTFESFKTILLKAVAKVTSDSSSELQELEISTTADTQIPSTPRVQDYGFTSHPDSDSPALIGFIGSQSDQPVAIKVDGKNRPTLNEKEVCIYSDSGQTIKHDEFGDTKYNAQKHVFNDGIIYAARKGDSIHITSDSDPVFFAWLNAVDVFIRAANTAISVTTPPKPTSIKGTITQGTDKVRLP